jgi:hypothetical protein
MLLLLRRFLVLVVLFFWQGGFTFYAAVVVPIAQQQLGHLRQGFITRSVTVWLNVAGAVALLALVWDLLVPRSPMKWRRRCRWLLWAAMVVALAVLVLLHGQMNDLLVPKGRIIRDADAFRTLHRLYLWVSTVQWACALLYLFITVSVWRGGDRRSAVGAASGQREEAGSPEMTVMNV